MTSTATIDAGTLPVKKDGTYRFTQRYHDLKVLERYSAKRKPGYMDKIREIGTPKLKESAVTGYWLTAEQELFLKTNYNPEDADGVERLQKMIFSAPARELEERRDADFYRQVFDEATSCAFDGCEQLKKSYQKDLKRLGGDCTSCDKAALQAKYKEKIKPFIPV